MSTDQSTSQTSETSETPNRNIKTSVKTSNRSKFENSVLGTRNPSMVTALAVVGMILIIPLNFAGPALFASPQTILIGCLIMGLWSLPFLLPSVVVRKPGSAIIASAIMGIIGVFTTPVGPMAIIGHVIGGALIEAPLACCLYKYKWWNYFVAAIAFGAFNGFGYVGYVRVPFDFSMTAMMVGTAVVSSCIGAALAIAIAHALKKANVGVSVDN